MMAKKVLLAGVALFALSGASVFAADMPVRSPIATKAPPMTAALFDWSGFYVGGVGGYGWGQSTQSGAASGSFDADGWMFGGTAGYNWQSGRAVLGVEGDLSWTGIDGSVGPLSTQLNWLGTGRLRAGYAVDAYLFYVTGGAAFGKVEAAASGLGSGSNTHVGWTAGAGVETMLAPNWTAKLEYLYVDLGRARYTGGANVDFTSHIVRAGLNYKF